MPSPARPAPLSFRPARRAGVLAALVLAGAAGCAQQREEGYYAPPRESTVTDAQSQAQQSRSMSLVRAPSQLQIGLKPDARGQARQPDAAAALESPPQAQDEPRATAQAQQGQAAQPAAPLSTLIPQAQTYLGTLPCFNPGMQCTAQRITVTLAPNHRWRARSAYLDQSRASGSPMTDQGCWREIPDHPPRILVLEGNGNVRADLALVGNALRVLAVNGQSPNLSYSLTRQPDLDPIDELAKEALPDCD